MLWIILEFITNQQILILRHSRHRTKMGQGESKLRFMELQNYVQIKHQFVQCTSERDNSMHLCLNLGVIY